MPEPQTATEFYEQNCPSWNREPDALDLAFSRAVAPHFKRWMDGLISKADLVRLMWDISDDHGVRQRIPWEVFWTDTDAADGRTGPGSSESGIVSGDPSKEAMSCTTN